jgi:hypothetical protein
MKDVPPACRLLAKQLSQHIKNCALSKDATLPLVRPECNAAAKHQILLFDASSFSTDSSFEESTKQLAQN